MGRAEAESAFPKARADGQLWAVHITPDGQVTDADAVGMASPADGWSWVHFDLLSAGAHEGLSRSGLPDPVRRMFTGPDETARFHVEAEWVAGVVPDFEHGCEGDDVRTGALRFFATERRLVSGRRTPLQSVNQLWRTLRTTPPPNRPDNALQRMRRLFVDELARLTGVLQRELDAVEDDLLETESPVRRQARAGSKLGRVRQRVAKLQRVTKPLARLEPENDLPPWTDVAGFESMRRHTLAVLDDLHALEDRAHALQDELTARQNEEANRRLYVLAVVTSVLAPTTLVTGFFGMNTGGMPWTQLPHGTWLASGLLVVSVGAMVWLLRRGGLL
jgi:Mg2+ and Co2+ transporter CorA